MINVRHRKKRLTLEVSSINKYKTFNKAKSILTFVLIPTIVFDIDQTYKESLFIDDTQYGKFITYGVSIEWLCWNIILKYLKVNK
jgi:hypothetical protein